ncbi:MAG: Uma2 family endonuclease [Leptolyngbyaceae bacterium]|nr:Uma2 family endonuclease [Leptolyngbyaceae bacterium]
MNQSIVNADDIAIPDIDNLVIEDDTPVDNFQSEKQQRLLVEPLYSSQDSSSVLPKPFIVAANVGLFFAIKQEPLVPDVFVSLGVQMPADWSQKRNRSYFVWEFGKVPELAIEIVSNRVGNELTTKKDAYARMGVVYYVVFDPLRQLQKPDQMDGNLLQAFVLTAGQYRQLPTPWFEGMNLGLTLWDGVFEGQTETWLRWCDRDQQVVPTGAERAEQEKQRAEQEKQRAEQEKQRAEQEKQRADAASARAQRLAEQLRAMGIDVDDESGE